MTWQPAKNPAKARRSLRRAASLLSALLLAALATAGCFSPRMDAAQSVLAIYDLYVKGDPSGVLEMGMGDEDVDAAMRAYEEGLLSALRENISSSGLAVEDSVLEGIADARGEAMKAMEATSEISSSDGDLAVVTLWTTYFDEEAIDEKAASDAIDKAYESELTDPSELMSLALGYYADNLVEGYRGVAPSSDKKEITVQCRKAGSLWVPEDMASFGEELGLTLSGQK